MISIKTCPICTMNALRVIVCKNGSINLRCASCFTTMFVQDLKCLGSIAKIGAEYEAKGHINKIGYIDSVFDAWREGAQADYNALVAERQQKVMATAAKKGE